MVEKFTVVEWEEGEVGGLLAVWGSDYDALAARLADEAGVTVGSQGAAADRETGSNDE